MKFQIQIQSLHLIIIIYEKHNITVLKTFLFRFEHNDPFLKNFIKNADGVNEAFGAGLLADIWPIFKYIPTKAVKLLKKATGDLLELIEGTYAEHEKNFDESECVRHTQTSYPIIIHVYRQMPTPIDISRVGAGALFHGEYDDYYA